jgi:predicted choloylglycine hydrolase
MMVGWAGGVGSVTGMNSRGLTCGEMTLISSRETFDGLPLLLMVRRMLESAGNLDEAVAIMKTGPRTIGWNYVLGDGKVPEARALEVDAEDCTVFTAMDPKENAETGHWALEDAVRRTNHPCGMTQIGKLIDRFGEKYGVTRDNLQMAIPLLKLQDTWQRYDWLGKRIQEQPGKMDVPRAIQLLCNGPVKSSGTLHSVVFDPKNQTIYLAIAASEPPVTATETPFVKIDLAPWFK